jgi:hypothetical protein
LSVEQHPNGSRLGILVELGQIGTVLQQDLIALGAEVTRQVELFKQGELDLESVCYWHKALAGAFFASADGVCFAVREAVLHNAHSFGIDFSQKVRRSLAPDSRLPLEKAAPLAFRSLARLFTADFSVDTSGEPFRGFKVLTDAREAFVHPKDHAEVCPFSLFPTLSSAAEWFLIQWRSLLVACTRALGHPLQGDTAPTPRFSFRDELLTAFARARAEWDEGKNFGDFIEDLAGVVCPLEETPPALSRLITPRTPSLTFQLHAGCAI